MWNDPRGFAAMGLWARAHRKSLFGGAPPAPTPAAVPAMPDPLSPDALASRRKTMADQSTGGRASTMLTTAAPRAAGTLAGNYASPTLGGGA